MKCSAPECDHVYASDPPRAVEVIAHLEQQHRLGPRKGAKRKALRLPSICASCGGPDDHGEECASIYPDVYGRRPAILRTAPTEGNPDAN